MVKRKPRSIADRAGLISPQVKLDVPLIEEKLDFQAAAGYFLASEKRNGEDYIGTEISGQLTVKVTDYLNWDVGAATAAMGDFFGEDSDDLYEVFSRFQMEL